MKEASTEDVKRLYETYPYPYGVGNAEPDALLTYLFRGYFLHNPLDGWRILDAGCGTGHKLAGLAVSYPRARFVGIELSASSVAVARDLMAKHRLSNVEVRRADILELPRNERYDVVQAFGVVHHLQDPQAGLNRLCGALAEDGLLSIWLYHPLGDFERLLQRELLQTLWRGDWADMAGGQEVMEGLGLDLSPTHYGPRYGPGKDREASALEANADAFMHPIVYAYRFAEALDMVRAAGMGWAAVDYVNLENTVKMIDLGDVADPFTARFCLRAADLLPARELQERYSSLPKQDQLKVIELAVRPRGFQMLAGRSRSYDKVVPRLGGNVIRL